MEENKQETGIQKIWREQEEKKQEEMELEELKKQVLVETKKVINPIIENNWIPEKLRELNFVLIGGDSKHPIEKGWQKKIRKIDDFTLQKHLSEGGNYGVQSNNSSIVINGVSYFLIIVDFDKREFQDKVLESFPETFTTTSGSSKQCYHLWFASDDNKPFKIHDEKLNTLADIIGAGNQVIAPGSKHNSGSIYSIVKDIPFAIMPYSEIKAILEPYDKSPKKEVKASKKYSPKGTKNDLTDKIYNAVSMNQVLKELNIDTSKNPTNCCFHTSVGGKCFGFNADTAHCFHCDGSWNAFSLIRQAKNLTDKETFEWFAEKGGLLEELKASRQKYAKEKEGESKMVYRAGDSFDKAINTFSDKFELAEKFIKIQPVYYERKNQFWIWDFDKFCWVEKDETDILNLISHNSYANTIISKERLEILESLKQVGRKNKPLDIKPTWVQFKNKVYDIETGESFEATPKYFVANPIDWKVGENEDTPTIDKLISNWVSEEDAKRLYEYLAFVTIPKYFIHSFIFLYAPPGTGKSTFVNLLIKFIGKHNQVATSIDRINNNSRFETYNWNKKLLITLSEVSDVDDLQNIGLINQATGEDSIAAEIKGGAGFNFINYGKFIYPTNKLLKVDENDGFGRRVRTIKFVNRFEKEKDVLEEIPDIEFENLARKCLRIGKDLWTNRQFTGDVNISERMKRYQEISKTPLEKFIETKCDLTDFNAKMLFDEFYAKYVHYLGCNDSKIKVSKSLRKMGFVVRLENWQKPTKTNLYGESVIEWESGSRIAGIKFVRWGITAKDSLSGVSEIGKKDFTKKFNSEGKVPYPTKENKGIGIGGVGENSDINEGNSNL